jgi:NAD(P)-dependent dehydrogenase (short-subunit alcohol dehydrogenase family)
MALERERLIGQTAMITGGGRGLGRAFALGLAATGMSVAVVSRTDDELAETVRHVESAGGRAAAFRTDVSSPQDVAETVKAVERRFGKIDLLINNAGVGGPVGPAWQVDAQDWWSCLEINVRGTFLCCHAVLPGMMARGQGRIINVASYAGTLAVPYMSAYNTSKTAVIRFTETLAAELRKHGIPVFSIEPGTVRTDMTNRLITSEEGRRWLPWCERLFRNQQDDSVEPATALVVFLSSGAGDELSGRVLSIRDRPADLAHSIDHIKRENLYTLQLPRPQPVLVRAVKDLLRPAKRRIERAFASGTRKS